MQKATSTQNSTTRSHSSSRVIEAFRIREVPDESFDLMLASLSKSTLKQYQSSLDRWFRFCDSCNINPFNLDESMVIKFLISGFKDGKSYSALNTDRCAISLLSLNKIGESSLIKRLLKACYELKPTVPKYSTMWGVNIVLDYLESLGNSSELSLKDLTYNFFFVKSNYVVHKLFLPINIQKKVNFFPLTLNLSKLISLLEILSFTCY